jgi:hypothetical protein
MSPSESQETQSESRSKGRDSAKSCEPEKRLSPSPVSQRDSDMSPIDEERLQPSLSNVIGLNCVL